MLPYGSKRPRKFVVGGRSVPFVWDRSFKYKYDANQRKATLKRKGYLVRIVRVGISGERRYFVYRRRR